MGAETTTDTADAEARATASIDADPRSPIGALHGDTDDELAEGTVVDGKYLLERAIGRGGMGVVYEGRHLGLDGKVAVKLMKRRSAATTTRLLREAKLASKLPSEHVARVLDVGDAREGAYVVMDLLVGESLGEFAARRGRIPVAEAIALMTDACRGLAAAHARGIVHRDFKPSNVFLAQVNGVRVVKVLDFGIAKDLAPEKGDATVTEASALLGSPFYMAPEQVREASSVDARADVWSAGITLFQLITGEMPFAARGATGVLAAIVADPPKRLRAIVPEAPRSIDAIVARCLAKDPKARFANGSELVSALDAAREPPTKTRAGWIAAIATIVVAVGIAASAIRVHERPIGTNDAAPAREVSSAWIPAPPTPIETTAATSPAPSESAGAHATKPKPRVAASAMTSPSSSAPKPDVSAATAERK